MPPKKPQTLFHPKKKKPAPPPAPGSPSKPKPLPPPVPTFDNDFTPPTGNFQEFKIMSSASNGWKYDGMKFDSRKPVDVMQWQAPVKLNRKDLRRDQPVTVQTAVGPMLGPDGKAVVGFDGKTVMVDAEGRAIHNIDPNKEKDKPKGPGAKKKFQKKTRQVFTVPEAQRQLRREERYPWILEDSSGTQTWQAQLDDVKKAQTHAFFMPAANDVFKFVPSHRWYKFQKKLNHQMPTDTADVESAYNEAKKSDPQKWLAKRRGGAVSSATVALFKAEAEGTVLSGGHMPTASGSSLGPGGRRLKTVNRGAEDLFGDDDEEGGEARKRRMDKEHGAEGDLDEAEFEEEFADDEEMANPDQDEEETKDTEERLKREYKIANKTQEGHIVDSDDEDDTKVKTKQEKAMQKLIRKREGNDAYDSDDDRNPYASSEESEEEEPAPPPPTIQEQHEQQLASRSATPKPATPSQPSPTKTHPTPVHRASSPSLGGHSVVAKRATSPKARLPQVLTNGTGGSPLSGRAASPSRASSPSSLGTNKRKALDDPSPSPTSPNGSSSSNKRRKSTAPAPVLEELTENMLIEWLRITPQPTTKDCIARFKPWVTGIPNGKTLLTGLVKRVARVKDGHLVLKSSSAAPSRAGSPTVPVA